MLQWKTLKFEQLDPHLLYQMLKLRVDVFVVEQDCPYPELDNKDILEGVHHLIGFVDDEIVAVARLLPAGASYPSVSIGRVAVSEKWREKKLGHDLMKKAVSECEALWPQQDIEIGAQNHLRNFYSKHGFEAYSEVYLEDGIPHVDMRRRA
ncbi:elaA protein [Vibrio ishigakensis]|uniref:Protein ElaA n=1 Tax=Vibrio ishigakensis TaxID=1481914 RepID=A0A0B8QP64_9VIBR|nr:GNAT family N-acetyltransferase [Vibrio ishigakensis]GAM76813.1 elaA protein [Vibrio ishigakensis]